MFVKKSVGSEMFYDFLKELKEQVGESEVDRYVGVDRVTIRKHYKSKKRAEANEKAKKT